MTAGYPVPQSSARKYLSRGNTKVMLTTVPHHPLSAVFGHEKPVSASRRVTGVFRVSEQDQSGRHQHCSISSSLWRGQQRMPRWFGMTLGSNSGLRMPRFFWLT